MAAQELLVTSQQMLLMVDHPALILRNKRMSVGIAELLELILVRATDLKGQRFFQQRMHLTEAPHVVFQPKMLNRAQTA